MADPGASLSETVQGGFAPDAKRSCPSHPFKLYSYWRSSASYRVRIALAMKGLDYTYVPVNLVAGEQGSEENVKRNPLGVVPTLEIEGGMCLQQSLPIIEYLDEVYKTECRLLPADPVARARVRAYAEIINSGIQPIQNLKILKKIGAKLGDEEKTQWAKDAIQDGLAALEKASAQHAGKYLYGDDVTLADICLVPQVYNANRFGVDMKQFPTLDRVYNDLIQLPAFEAAHPDKQPDAQQPAK